MDGWQGSVGTKRDRLRVREEWRAGEREVLLGRISQGSWGKGSVIYVDKMTTP